MSAADPADPRHCAARGIRSRARRACLRSGGASPAAIPRSVPPERRSPRNPLRCSSGGPYARSLRTLPVRWARWRSC